jgi:hypothetical protein
MSAEIIREVREEDLPLCPVYVSDPGNEMHRLAVRALDAFYDAAPKNDDGEMLSAATETCYRAATVALSSRMRLYRAGLPLPGQGAGYVESYYFRCQVCGFTLPAVWGAG